MNIFLLYTYKSMKYESSNLIYVVIFQGCKEEYIGEMTSLMKEWINI